MHADLQGALDQLNRSYRAFENNGKPMAKDEVEKVLKEGLKRGYKSTADFKDGEVDKILNS